MIPPFPLEAVFLRFNLFQVIRGYLDRSCISVHMLIDDYWMVSQYKYAKGFSSVLIYVIFYYINFLDLRVEVVKGIIYKTLFTALVGIDD